MDNNNFATIYWIIGITVAVLLVIGGIFWYVLLRGPVGGSPTSTNTPTGLSGSSGTSVEATGQQGGSGASGETGLAVAGQNGSAVVVHDFTKDPQTKADPNNAGQYYLTGDTDVVAGVTPYSIFFVEANQSFNITLLKEPIKDIRIQAETELMQRLNITEAQACSLNYYVSVPAQVSEFYAGKNLGLSFCPGAVVLP